MVNNAVSLNSAVMTSSRVIGPVVAGALIATVGFGWAFLADAISYLAVIAALAAIRPAELRQAPITPRGKGQVREGLRYARSVPDLFFPLLMMAVVGTLAYNFQVVFPLFTIRDLGGDESMYTWLFATVSVGALVGALATARRRSIGIRMVGLSSMAFGAALTLMAVAPNAGAAFLVGLLVGFASISFLTASTAIVQLRSDPSMRGRVLALQAMVFLGSTPIGGPIVGWIAQHFGARYAIAVGAAAALLTGAWGVLVDRRQRLAAMTAAEADEAVADALAELGGQSSPRSVVATRGLTPAVEPRRAASDAGFPHTSVA
jgi:MFS family permease